jgi:hypothetical protein
MLWHPRRRHSSYLWKIPLKIFYILRLGVPQDIFWGFPLNFYAHFIFLSVIEFPTESLFIWFLQVCNFPSDTCSRLEANRLIDTVLTICQCAVIHRLEVLQSSRSVSTVTLVYFHSSTGLKRLGREADHSLHLAPKSRKQDQHTSTALYTVMV